MAAAEGEISPSQQLLEILPTMATKTMAILSDSKGLPPELLEVLGSCNHRLLFVVENAEKMKRLQESLHFLKIKPEIDFISCEKEGCWEADKILISIPGELPREIVQKIKNVATQKPVWVISNSVYYRRNIYLQSLLPNSKIVEIGLKKNMKEISLSSKDIAAKEEVHRLFKASGFTINK